MIAEHKITGLIGTPFSSNTGFPQEYLEQYWEKVRKDHPVGRMGVAQDIASLITFVASNEADFMSGSSVVMDGAITCKSYLQ